MSLPPVKNKLSLYIAIGLLVPLIYFIIDRIQLLSVGAHVIGVVEEVTASNNRCSERRNKRTYYYDCTEYSARIGFDTKTIPPIHSTFILSGGDVRGHNQPISYSSRQKGDPTKVIYDPSNIDRVYEDTIWGIWGVPIMNFIMQIFMFFGAFTEKKNARVDQVSDTPINK